MYYSPSQLSPNAQEVVVNTNNTFSWTINGDESTQQTKYNLYIRKISDNTQIYTSGLQTSVIGQHTVPSGTLTNNIDYKWQVRSYYDDTHYSESEWVIFFAHLAPSLILSSIPSNQQNYEFAYEYEHSIPVKTYKIELYQSDDLIVSSGDIYPPNLVTTASTPLTYTINGMLSGTEYKIKCIVITQQDKIVDSGFSTFTVVYDYLTALPSLTVTPLNNIGAIQLDWENLVQILGSVSGDYSFEGTSDKYIHLEPGAILTYHDGITIPQYFTQIFKIKLPIGFTGDFLRYNSDYKIGYNGTKFYYQRGYRITAGMPHTLSEDWFTVVILPTKVIIIDESIETLL